MDAAPFQVRGHRIVLVLGIHVDETSEDLLRTVRALTSEIAEAELHVVRFPFGAVGGERHVDPARVLCPAVQARTRLPQWQIAGLCQAVGPDTSAHIVVHASEGEPVADLARLARRVRADVIIVETRPFHPFALPSGNLASPAAAALPREALAIALTPG
jgi:hypothetical protein